ncbi:MAG TPA: hypothetical protein VLU92_14955, partial [Candidatus Dormibacteraeota bacterium]|nr:hypothetical protein [Candidatus Dormibacteraeota bacterium]
RIRDDQASFLPPNPNCCWAARFVDRLRRKPTIARWVLKLGPVFQAWAFPNGTEQEFSSSYEHLEGDTTGVVDPDVSFEAYF